MTQVMPVLTRIRAVPLPRFWLAPSERLKNSRDRLDECKGKIRLPVVKTTFLGAAISKPLLFLFCLSLSSLQLRSFSMLYVQTGRVFLLFHCEGLCPLIEDHLLEESRDIIVWPVK